MSLKWFCEPCEKAISERSLSANVASHCEDKLDHLIRVIKKIMEKYMRTSTKKLAETGDVTDLSKLEARIFCSWRIDFRSRNRKLM